ncbi:helix-turn-helix transcriptional regulator [Shewanella gelidii]|uniref:HTH araC/xylS-type domain-containing protein n=1 Tax=Shewanella gelidii TaxID=1642821 RepID=A0A917JZ71_9GAMM|nr:helix-turn-helix transcriptional regulator [Shewanella gelidii]MCL1099683.1 helix-turn-helix transcriptional regulator [Shewanella gelidii]GGI93280.1 hypothetical protein GCM10009332_33220 [Shewanella gelidii]
MINYKCRQAIHTKIVLEYCEDIGFAVPEPFEHYKTLNDEDSIGFYTITNLLKFIESNSDNRHFFIDLIPYFERRLIQFIKEHVDLDQTPAQNLLNFVNYYNHVSDLNWGTQESEDNLCLDAQRNPRQYASQYDDLFLYFCATNLFRSSFGEKNNVNIKLPFERAFYGKNIDLFDSVEFDNQSMKVCVTKNEMDYDQLEPLNMQELKFSDRVRAAANNIPPQNLNLTSLSNTIGMTPRTLQRSLKQENTSPNKIINNIKVNLIKNSLQKHQGNIKRSAYECGFDNLSTFSRFFSKSTGMTPRQFTHRI